MTLHRRDPHEEEFNSPAVMLTRAMYLLWLAAVPAGGLLTLAGAIAHRWPMLGAGIALCFVAWFLRDWLRRRERLEETAKAFDQIPVLGARAEETHLARLVELLREWDAMERRRGTAGFDLWAVQALRNDILALVAEDPALERLFHSHPQAA